MAGQGARERPPGPSRTLSINFSIAAEIVDRHPEVRAGGFVASGLTGAAAELADRPPTNDTRQELIDRGLSIETLASEPVVADWRAAIAECGLKPSTYKSSVEQLVRRTLKSGALKTPLPLVDMYCDVATRHLAPLGAYDVGVLPADAVELRLADPASDAFHPLGAKDGEMPMTPAVAVYACGATVICWAFNCRDSRVTCLNPETEVGLFLGEAVTSRQYEPLRAAFEDLGSRLSDAGASVGPAVFADASSPSVEIPSP